MSNDALLSPPDLTTQTGEYPQSVAGPEAINLGLGQPSPRLLPLSLLGQAALHRFGPEGDPLQLQYGAIAGPPGFREALAALLTERYRYSVAGGELVVTGGISSALSFVSQVFATSGQIVVCSDPTYFLARGVFESQGLRTVGIPVDEGGLRVDLLEERIVRDGLRPAFIYCMPSFHNPRGVTLQPDRARRLVELAERFDFVVVADEPYVMLHLGDQPPACMMSYDQQRGRVLSLGSFSKILGPGLRLGWIHAEPVVLERFCQHGALRSGGGLNPVIASLVHEIIARGQLGPHIDHLRSTFAHRARALCAALRRELPELWVPEPEGGYFVWLELPEGMDSTALLERAVEHAVRFTPGSRCAVQLDLSRYVRLCFAFYEAAELELGVRRLAQLLRFGA
ncbi:MAG: PLP-dependent aminotransferase family protein [Myxococcota bacterium]